jgi:hypothetical protein
LEAGRVAELSRFSLRVAANIDGVGGMGAKYLPTIKDQKASQRFQQKQNRLPEFKKSASNRPAKKGKKR